MLLRWLIGIMVVANLLAVAAVSGMFGPLPYAGSREPGHLNRQIRPDSLHVQAVAIAEPIDQAVVGAPAPAPAIAASELSQ
jgi:hypothetical protein